MLPFHVESRARRPELGVSREPRGGKKSGYSIKEAPCCKEESLICEVGGKEGEVRTDIEAQVETARWFMAPSRASAWGVESGGPQC